MTGVAVSDEGESLKSKKKNNKPTRKQEWGSDKSRKFIWVG